MSVTYEKRTDATEAALKLAYEVRDQWHQHLKNCEPPVRISVLLAFNYDADGREMDEPPMMSDGHRDVARTKIIPLVDRADELADVRILLDGHYWKDTLPEAEKKAILDHALQYVDLQLDENNCIKTDSLGRPKLTTRDPDWKMTGFEAVARRHGEASIEVKNAKAFQERFGAVTLEAGSLYAGV